MRSRDVLRRQRRIETDFGVRHGSPEQISLDEVHSRRLQDLELRTALDPFGHRGDIETARQCDGRGDDRRAVPSRCAALHNRPVDLELVEWEALEVAPRGIAYAAIIEDDANAEVLQLPDREQVSRQIPLDERSVGNFEFEP